MQYSIVDLDSKSQFNFELILNLINSGICPIKIVIAYKEMIFQLIKSYRQL